MSQEALTPLYPGHTDWLVSHHVEVRVIAQRDGVEVLKVGDGLRRTILHVVWAHPLRHQHGGYAGDYCASIVNDRFADQERQWRHLLRGVPSDLHLWVMAILAMHDLTMPESLRHLSQTQQED